MTVWTPKLTASKLSGSDYANARLRGTVWERVDLAKAFYGALTTAGGVLGKLHVSPNVLTLVSLVIAGAAGGFVLVGQFGVGAALMVRLLRWASLPPPPWPSRRSWSDPPAPRERTQERPR